MSSTLRIWVPAAGVLFIAALLAQIARYHGGLLYPDGYQYILMARGIGEHLRPITQLGPDGAAFSPSFDAATKPLFAAAIAAVAQLGPDLRDAAQSVSIVAGAAVVPLCAGVVLRLTSSYGAAALSAFVLLLGSPTLSFWWGYAGPDALAWSLVLAACLAGSSEKPIIAGALAGLAGAARPEWLVVAAALALAALATRYRRTAVTMLIAGVASLGVVVAVLRPPVSWHESATLGVAAMFATAAAVAAVRRIGAAGGRGPVAAVCFVVALVIVAFTRSHASVDFAQREWALLAGAAVILPLIALERARVDWLVPVIVFALLLGAYGYKNPGSERYVADLVPMLAVTAGVGVAALRPVHARLAAALAALVMANPIIAGAAARTPGLDVFAEVAPGLSDLPPGPMVSAAPDAYGVLFPNRAQFEMRPGRRGNIILDAVQRERRPELTASGPVVRRVRPFFGFRRVEGEVDSAAVLVVRGVVVRRRTPAADR